MTTTLAQWMNVIKVILFVLLYFTSYSQDSCFINTNDSSWIPNWSFEDTVCCPHTVAVLSCAANWQNGTYGTVDYFNTCNYVHSWVHPIPHGNAYASFIAVIYPENPSWDCTVEDWCNYREYISTCVSLTPDNYIYCFQIKFDPVSRWFNQSCPFQTYSNVPPVELVVYGNTRCYSRTFVWGCPELDTYHPTRWTQLGSVTYSPNNNWSEICIKFSATTNINQIMLGVPCTLDSAYTWDEECFPYFYIDALMLTKVDTIICNDNNPCTVDQCVR